MSFLWRKSFCTSLNCLSHVQSCMKHKVMNLVSTKAGKHTEKVKLKVFHKKCFSEKSWAVLSVYFLLTHSVDITPVQRCPCDTHP